MCVFTTNSENIQCWTLEQITDLIYQDNDLNQDGSLDMGELYAMLTGWGIVGKVVTFNKLGITNKRV